MGLPLEDCPKTNRPYIAFTTTTSSTTTPQPTLEYYQLPASGSICPVDPCICGSLFVPRGLKYGNSGSTLTIGSNTYSLAHPLDGFVDKEQILITTSTKLASDTVLQTDNITINLGKSVNLVGVIRVLVKIRETQKIIGQVITGSFNESVPVSFFRVNLIDSFNLTNLTLQIEISSLCKNSREVCCDRLPSSLQFTNIVNNITCSTTTSTTTTTTTTLPPFCSQFNLPDSFYITVVGYEALDGQQQISLVTRSGRTWSTSGSFPCGASYSLLMTCDSANSRFTYSGSINCCEEATKTIIQPTSTPLIHPDAVTPKIVVYTDCYCANCTTTTTTTTTTTDFPTTPPPPPPVPCEETVSLTINGYAFYRTQKVNVNVPGVGSLMAKCAGGHICNRTNFLPQLITATQTIDAQPISLNNLNLTDKNVSATFSFNVPDTSILKNGASVRLKCLSQNGCHTGVTWVVLTTEKDGKTSILFNGCVLPNELDNLDFECENCCDWDGEGVVKFSTECDNLQEDVKLLKLSNYLWELDTTLSCGDKINALVKCKPEVDYIDLDSCKNKWEVVSFSFPCAQNARVTGNLLEPCECDKAPIFEFTADNFNDCNCCYDCSISQSINDFLPFTPYNPNCLAPPILQHKMIIPDSYSLPVLININGGVNDDLLIDGQSITNELNLDPGPYPDTVGAGCVGAHTIGSKDGPFRDLVNGGITFPINKREFILACRDSIGAGAGISINITINPFAEESCNPQIPFIFKL